MKTGLYCVRVYIVTLLSTDLKLISVPSLDPTETEGPPNSGSITGYVHDRELCCAVCSSQTPMSTSYIHWGKNHCTGAAGQVVPRHICKQQFTTCFHA